MSLSRSRPTGADVHIMTAMIPDGKSQQHARTDPLGSVGEAPFFQAGLAGYSDAAMRRVARRHGCPYCVTEAMLDFFLINGGKGQRAAALHDEDHPIAGQLMGSHPLDMAQGAKILIDMGYDVVDINLACPVKKIKKKCRGGHLLSAPDEAIRIIQAVADAVRGQVPLSIKLRRGYDESAEATESFHRIFQAVIDHGFAAATVHGRTVQQKYIGPSRWPFLADLTARYADARARGFRIFGSGDIFSPQAIFDMIEQTGVDAVSVARGCIGDPWIFQQARQIMAGQAPTEPSLNEQRRVLAEHFQLSVGLHGEQVAGRTMRKFGIMFSRHHPQAQAVKDAFINVKSLADWQAALDAYYPPSDRVEVEAEALRAS